MKSTLRRLASLFTLALAVTAIPAQAGPYSGLYVFGDSLSDTGNVFAATGGAIPAAPYFNGRFTNGPNWVDNLAFALGVPSGATAALLGGTNYAFGGARTGTATSPVLDIGAQLFGLWAPSHATADSNALYVVVGGGNDMRDARSAFQGNTAADAAGRQAAAAAAANNLFQEIMFLASKGARHVLIANLPDLGATPEAFALGLTAASTDATQRFNALLSTFESQLEAAVPGLDVDMADWFGRGLDVQANPGNYGVINTSAPCNGFPGSPNLGALTACNVSVFSDGLHPSALMHNLLARDALTALGIPEPGTGWLLLLSLGALGLARRKVA